MKLLPKIALFLSFFFIFSSLVFADCDINECLYPEHGQTGTCQEGAVVECDTGRKKCINSEWKDTIDSTLDLCKVTYRTGTWLEPTSQQYDETIKNDAENETPSMYSYGYANVQGIVLALRRALIGSSTPAEEGVAAYNSGAVGAMGNIMATLYQKPPASSVEYIAYLGEKAGFIPKAYAQGVGFRGFFPLIRVWSAMRNVAYMFFALVFVIVGLMVIFRAKIDPRTVVTVQAALPRIVIALLLVTFSYAIVGLLVDVMNVVIGLFVWLFHTAGLIEFPQTTISEIQGNNVLVIILKMFGAEVFGCSIPLIGSAVCQLKGTGPGWAINKFTSHRLGGWAGAGVKIGGALLGNSLVEFIFALALAFAVFKLLFNLIMAYVSIILSVILAPLQIALNAIPNWNTFKGWIMNLLANLSVFPTIAGMLMLGAALTGRSGGLGVSEFPGMAETGWRPPLIGGGGADAQKPILLLIGYGIILMTPGIVDQMKKLFQVPPAEMPMIGAAIGAGAGPAKGAVGLGVTAGKFKAAEYLEAKRAIEESERKKSLLGLAKKVVEQRARG